MGAALSRRPSVCMLEPVPATDFIQQPWANGNGQTTELAAGPDRTRWRWRISMARVATDGAFSVLPGVRRQLAPLDAPLELQFDDGEVLPARRLQVLQFDGGRSVRCRLPDGPGRDFNLMLRDGAEGRLIVRPLLGSMVLLPAGTRRWFVYVLAGACRAGIGSDALELDTDEAAWIQPPPGQRAILEGAGEVAIVQLDEPAV